MCNFFFIIYLVINLFMCKVYNEGIRDSNLFFYFKDLLGGLKGIGLYKMCF